MRSSAVAQMAVVALGVAAVCRACSSLCFVAAYAVRSTVSTPPVARRAVAFQNPVKTVSDTMDDFYKAYPQPPVMPMFRMYLMDILSQTHITVSDARFKYDAVFAFGLRESFNALMGPYDGLTDRGETEKIWQALVGSIGLDASQMEADAKAVEAYARATQPSEILQQLEADADNSVVQALRDLSSGLYSRSCSVGVFKIMELSGAEVKKDSLEEWMKAIGLPATKANKDLDSYLALQEKLRGQMEMIREVQIREKKQLAARLEEKARALAAKAEAASKEREPVEA